MYRTASEVDGYKHFYHLTREFTAKSALKRRILHGLGWTVVSVPYFEKVGRPWLAQALTEASGRSLKELRRLTSPA